MPDQETTGRRVVRFVVDTAVTTDQVELVRRVLARALCAADDDHIGPCRVAWDIWHVEEGAALRGVALDGPEVATVWSTLAALEVMPGPAATADLVAELEGPRGLPAPLPDVAQPPGPL